MPRFYLWLVASSVIVIAVLGCLLWREHREVAVLRTEVMRNAAARNQVAALQRSVVAARKNPTLGSREPADIGAVEASPLDKPRVLSEIDRQIRARLLQNQRWSLLSKKADIIAGLNLPPEKRAMFKDLLVERDYAESDARDAAGKVGIDPHSSAATEAAGDAMSKVDERIKALLGDADYQKYCELAGADVVWPIPSRNMMAGFFIDAGTQPLTAEQTKVLARAFAQEINARAGEGNGQMGEPDPVTGFNPSQKMILDQAAQALSPAQMETLRNFFLHDNQLGALMKAAQSAGPSR